MDENKWLGNPAGKVYQDEMTSFFADLRDYFGEEEQPTIFQMKNLFEKASVLWHQTKIDILHILKKNGAIWTRLASKYMFFCSLGHVYNLLEELRSEGFLVKVPNTNPHVVAVCKAIQMRKKNFSYRQLSEAYILNPDLSHVFNFIFKHTFPSEKLGVLLEQDEQILRQSKKEYEQQKQKERDHETAVKKARDEQLGVDTEKCSICGSTSQKEKMLSFEVDDREYKVCLDCVSSNGYRRTPDVIRNLKKIHKGDS